MSSLLRADLVDQDAAWRRDTEYLACLNLHYLTAEYVRSSCKKANVEQTLESWVKLDNADLDGLADAIAIAIRDAWKVRTTLRQDAIPKFSELVLVDIANFYNGLENLIGYPPTHTDWLDSMRREHEKGAEFADRKGRRFDPKVEWNIVMRTDSLNIKGAGCVPTFNIPRRDCGKPLGFYMTEAKKWSKDFDSEFDVLTEAEVAALRLWTGPMHNEYAEVLRNSSHQKSSAGAPYVATLHAINSGITKLARHWRLPSNRKVYRGYRAKSLMDLKEDAFGCVGGVETCVLATSEDMNVAIDYSEDGAFILEINVGQVNRGADVSWLSQFPHEKEVLFNAQSNLEFVRSPHLRFKPGGGTILVGEVCISANLRSKTLEQFVSLRKDLHRHMVDVHVQQALQNIYMLETGCSHEIIKIIGNKCREQADAIAREAETADVELFNKGTIAYLGLVDTAIMFPARSIEIIDMALHWFETQKADPAALDQLKGWQLKALREAFKVTKPPTVTMIVLEQTLQVESLFEAKSLDVRAIDNAELLRNLVRLLSMNPRLESLEVKIALATAETWEAVFNELCPDRPRLRINGFHIAEYAISTLQRLELRTSDNLMASMIAPALQLHPPIALASLSLHGTPIACTGARSLGRAFTGLHGLRCLDLRSCRIACWGCTGIAENLCALTELQDLRLAHNIVDDGGFHCLASTIQAHGRELARLESVDMCFNKTALPSRHCGLQCTMKSHIISKLSIDLNVLCVAWRPGGNQIASGFADNTIIIWDTTAGDQVSTLKGHSHCVTSVEWCPWGKRIASGSRDKSIIIWDAKSGEQVSKLAGHTDVVTSVAWCTEGDQIASGSADNSILIWEVKTGEQVLTLKGHTCAVNSVAWSAEGDQIASASKDRTIIIWDAKSGEQVSTLMGHTGEASTVAWRPRPGGDQLASGSFDKTIIVWDLKTGAQVLMLKGHTREITSVSWRPGGDRIASASNDSTIIIWDAKTGDKVSTLQGHTDCVTSVSWCPVSDQIVSACGDPIRGGGPNEIIIWDAKTDEQVSTLNLKGHTAAITSVTWCPWVDQIASASWDKTIIVWDTKSGNKVSTLKGHTDYVSSVAWRPLCDQIATGSRDKTIIIWDVKTSKRISTLEGHTNWVNSLAWRPWGDRIASGSEDHSIIIWDANTGEQVLTLKGHSECVTSVAWHPGPGADDIASGSDDNSIIIWDAKNGKQVQTLKGHISYVKSVAYCPGGVQIASGSADHTIIIWDVETGDQLWTLKGHTSTITSVAWRPGGNQIASGSLDTTVILWDAKTGGQASKLKGHTSWATSVAWRPWGDQMASASYDKTISIWDGNSVHCKSTRNGHNTHITNVSRQIFAADSDLMSLSLFKDTNRYQIASASDDKKALVILSGMRRLATTFRR